MPGGLHNPGGGRLIEPNPSLETKQQNNWGQTTHIVGGQQEKLVSVQLPSDMVPVEITIRAKNVVQGTGCPDPVTGIGSQGPVRPFALVEWGNGNVTAKDLIDCTGGAQISVNGTTVYVTVLLLDAQRFPPTCPPPSLGLGNTSPSADFEAQASVGIVPYPQRNTTFIAAGGEVVGEQFIPNTPPSIPPGTQQGRMNQVRGSSNNSCDLFLMLFDLNVPAGDPAPPVAPAPLGPNILEVIAVPHGPQTIGPVMYLNSRPFLRGVVMVWSKTAAVLTPPAAETCTFDWFLEIEVQNN